MQLTDCYVITFFHYVQEQSCFVDTVIYKLDLVYQKWSSYGRSIYDRAYHLDMLEDIASIPAVRCPDLGKIIDYKFDKKNTLA